MAGHDHGSEDTVGESAGHRHHLPRYVRGGVAGEVDSRPLCRANPSAMTCLIPLGAEISYGLDDLDMGPHVGKSELDSALEYLDIGREEGATLAYGSSELDREGYFVEPAVFTDVELGVRIAQEEIFGPVLSVIPVSDYEQAIDVANGVKYGLSASIVTDDHDKANWFVEDIDAGIVKINQKTTGLELHVLSDWGVRRRSGRAFVIHPRLRGRRPDDLLVESERLRGQPAQDHGH
nr:aldehyde dehydrogenase family protein [Halegenticoccus tardaugens]